MNKYRVWDKQEKSFIKPEMVALKPDGSLLLDTGKEWVNSTDIERFSVDFNTQRQDRDDTFIFERDLLDFDETEWGSEFTPEVVSLINITELSGTVEDLNEWRRVIGNTHESHNA